MRAKLILSVVCASILYLAGPLIAGLFGIGDRDGPRIYASEYHTALYRITYSMTHDDKPRIAWDAGERPLFYGLPRTRRSR
jgi:hypothetical protein